MNEYECDAMKEAMGKVDEFLAAEGIEADAHTEEDSSNAFTESAKYVNSHQEDGRYPVIDVVDFVSPPPKPEKLYSNQLVKTYVTKLFGSVPNKLTYRRWREKAGCDKSQPGMTLEQAVKLAAIAKLKSLKKQHRHTDKQIDALAKKRSHIAETHFFLDAAESGMVLGRQLVASLASMGITVTTARLKRLIPKLRANKLYNVGKVAIALIKEDGFTN